MLGADGVVVGTRFLASEEALTPPAAWDRVARATGDDTVRKTRAYAVPPAALTITKARMMTDSTRCCWTHCQTNTPEC